MANKLMLSRWLYTCFGPFDAQQPLVVHDLALLMGASGSLPLNGDAH